MKKFINWLKNSFEGDDGKSSYRRLTTFGIFILIAYMVFWDRIYTNYRLWAFISLLLTLLLLIGLVTFDQIIKLRNGDKDTEGPKFPPPPPIREGDEIKVTVDKINPE